jgi:hypothetical protein
MPRVRNWEYVAAGTLRDLKQPQQVQVEVSGPIDFHLGLRAYAKAASNFYNPADDHFELMTVADVLAPLLLYLRLNPDEEAVSLSKRLLTSLPGFHYPSLHYIGNRYPNHPSDTFSDLWYFFENGLIKLAWIAIISSDPILRLMMLDGMQGAITLAQRVNYCFPLFAEFGKPGGPVPVGTPSNYSVAGLYAFGALLAAELSKEPTYYVEAKRALSAIRHLPVDLMYHEPQQLGFGAATAAVLAQHNDKDMARLANGLVRAQLRMAYWHEDPYALKRGYHVRGMLQACASLLYPAFKEEVESVLPWVFLLQSGLGPTELILKFMNLARQHSFAFFELYLTGHAGNLPFIPYENLGTTELPEMGSIGKEIYGAGEVFWLYLLFEALAYTEDPDLCIIFLDLLEPKTLAAFPPQRRRFIAYNPTPHHWDGAIYFRYLTSEQYHMMVKGGEVHLQLEGRSLMSGVNLQLAPAQWCEIELIPRE